MGCCVKLFDSHCHLDFAVFDQDREALFRRAADVGVEHFLVPGVEAGRWQNVITLAQRPDCFAALGLHPCFLSSHHKQHLQQLDQLLSEGKAVAVGEIGLDYWQGPTEADEQQYFFDAQLELAKRYQLPVVLHVRKAHDQVLARLRKIKLSAGGFVHAFSGSLQQAEQYIGLGFKLGFGGALSYERAKKLRRLVVELPLEAIVLETDSPDMVLAGYPGIPNEPCRVAEICQLIAELRSEDKARIAEQTSRNVLQTLRLVND